MTLEWHGEASLQAIRRKAAEGMLAAALHLQAQHKARLGTANPPPHKNPAPRGEYPHKRTGAGQAGVIVVPATVEAVMQTGRVQVGFEASAKHLDILSARGWKGLLDTMEAVKPEMEAITRGG